MTRVEVEGLASLRAKLKRMGFVMDERLSVGSKQAADELLRRTMPYVPRDSGKLRRSGRTVKGRDGSWSVGFGGPSAPYAIYVHEMLENEHAPPTRAKFLEATYLEAREEMAETVMAEAKKALTSRGRR